MGNVVGVRPISSGRAGGRGPVKLAVDGLFGQARDHADVDGVCSRCGICPAHFVREAWVGSPGRKIDPMCPNSHTVSENSVSLSRFEQTGSDRPFNLSGIS